MYTTAAREPEPVGAGTGGDGGDGWHEEHAASPTVRTIAKASAVLTMRRRSRA